MTQKNWQLQLGCKLQIQQLQKAPSTLSGNALNTTRKLLRRCSDGKSEFMEYTRSCDGRILIPIQYRCVIVRGQVDKSL